MNVILGKYKEKSIYFKTKNHPVVDPLGAEISPIEFEFRTHEEKETDVNIAIHILKDAFQNEYDTAYIVSADSDISPAVQMCRKFFPKKQYQFIFPYESFSITNKEVANGIKQIRKKRMEENLLPEICIVDGKNIVCPYEYKKSDSCESD